MNNPNTELDPEDLAETIREFITEYTGYNPGLAGCRLFAEFVAACAAREGNRLTQAGLGGWRLVGLCGRDKTP
jgi:hypothetical protein